LEGGNLSFPVLDQPYIRSGPLPFLGNLLSMLLNASLQALLLAAIPALSP